MARQPLPPFVKKACAYGFVARNLTRSMLGRLRPGTSGTVIDNGYVGRGSNIGLLRTGKIVDPPAYLLMLGRVEAPNGERAQLYLHPLNAGRDLLYVAGQENSQPMTVPFFTAEPTGFQNIGAIHDQTFPDQGLPDWRMNCVSYGGFVPALGAVSVTFWYHSVTPPGQINLFPDYGEIRVILASQGLYQVQYTDTGFIADASPSTSVRIATSAVKAATGYDLFYPYQAPITFGAYEEGWATAAPLPSIDGSFTFALASTLAAYTPASGDPAISEPWSFVWITTGKSNLVNGAQVSSGLVVRDWMMDAVVADPANIGHISGYGSNNMLGAQWVVASGKAYMYLVDATNWTHRPDITAPQPPSLADTTFESPYGSRIYVLDPVAGSAIHTDVDAGLWANPGMIAGTINNDVLDTAYLFPVGGCASATTVYFVVFNVGKSVVSTAFVPRVRITAVDIQTGAVSTVLTHDGVFFAGEGSTSGNRVNQVAWIGNGKLAFICTQAVPDPQSSTTHLVDAVLGIFDTANNSLTFSAKVPEQVWRDMADAYITAPGDESDSSGLTPFAGALDCIVQEQVDPSGAISTKAQIIFSAGGLGVAGANFNNTGFTYITRDSGVTWVKIAQAGSGVATLYAGNQVQFRSARKDL